MLKATMANEKKTAPDFRKVLIDGETDHQYLTKVLNDTKTNFKPLPGLDPNIDDINYYRFHQIVNCDEVYPCIYIGDAATAKNKKYLKMLGVTHVLNAAEGKRFGFVNTNKEYYNDMTIEYLGLPLADMPHIDISKYFYSAASFIEDAVTSGGKVLVHCMLGMSRSATCVLAYLMIKKEMLAAHAIRTVRDCRDIRPNKGFMYQLANLDNQLRRQRL